MQGVSKGVLHPSSEHSTWYSAGATELVFLVTTALVDNGAPLSRDTWLTLGPWGLCGRPNLEPHET